jgi:outer membrane immunogenic protein
MRILLRTGIVLAAMLGGPAYAADLAVSPASYDWSGYYIGVQGGGGWGESEIYAPFDDVTIDVDIEGGFAGGHTGALWQFDTFVVGAEAEANASWIDGETEFAPLNLFNSEIEWFGSLSGKLGFALDRFLIYGTGGLAFGEIQTGQTAASSFTESQTYFGWTAGAGIDYAVTDQIILGLQYRYYDFGEEDFTPAGFDDRDQDVDLHTVSAKASYKF